MIKLSQFIWLQGLNSYAVKLALIRPRLRIRRVLSRDPKRMGDRFSDNTCVKGPEKVSFLLFAEPLILHCHEISYEGCTPVYS
jgi:hypothetical protein